MNEGLLGTAEGETFFPVNVVRMELNLHHFYNDTFHSSGFLCQDTGIMELDAVTLTYTVLSHGRFCQVCQWCSLILVSVEHPVCQL
jgi:hypothetical protein